MIQDSCKHKILLVILLTTLSYGVVSARGIQQKRISLSGCEVGQTSSEYIILGSSGKFASGNWKSWVKFYSGTNNKAPTYKDSSSHPLQQIEYVPRTFQKHKLQDREAVTMSYLIAVDGLDQDVLKLILFFEGETYINNAEITKLIDDPEAIKIGDMTFDEAIPKELRKYTDKHWKDVQKKLKELYLDNSNI